MDLTRNIETFYYIYFFFVIKGQLEIIAVKIMSTFFSLSSIVLCSMVCIETLQRICFRNGVVSAELSVNEELGYIFCSKKPKYITSETKML